MQLETDTVWMVSGTAVLLCLDNDPNALADIEAAFRKEGLRIEKLQRGEILDAARHMTTECLPTPGRRIQ